MSPNMEGSYKYIAQAATDKRQGVVLQLGANNPFTVKNKYKVKQTYPSNRP
jgi:hypothetical protein